MEQQTETTTVPGTEVVKNLFTGYFNEVVNSYPSVFTKDDVILLLNRINKDVTSIPQPKSVEISNEWLEEIEGEIAEKIEDCIDGIDVDDIVELELYNREIEVTLNKRVLTTELRDTIIDSIRDHINEKVS